MEFRRVLFRSHSSGHDSSIRLVTLAADSPLANATIPSQKESEPTAFGIRSEASKRTTSALATISAICLVISDEYCSLSKLWCGESQPPALAHGPPHSSEVRNLLPSIASLSLRSEARRVGNECVSMC